MSSQHQKSVPAASASCRMSLHRSVPLRSTQAVVPGVTPDPTGLTYRIPGAIQPFSDRGLETDLDELACMNILHSTSVLRYGGNGSFWRHDQVQAHLTCLETHRYNPLVKKNNSAPCGPRRGSMVHPLVHQWSTPSSRGTPMLGHITTSFRMRRNCSRAGGSATPSQIA